MRSGWVLAAALVVAGCDDAMFDAGYGGEHDGGLEDEVDGGAAAWRARVDGLWAEDEVGVVFLGDSITEAGHYTAVVEDTLMARLPAVRFSFHNAGTSGDRLGWRVEERLEADVLARGASLVVVQFGMNDGRYAPDAPGALDAFREGMGSLLWRLSAPVVLVVSPTFPDPFGPVVSGRAVEPSRVFYPAVMRRFGEVARAVAGAAGVGFVDVLGAMEAATARWRAVDASLTLVPDGIHPDEGGALVMADVMLEVLIGVVPDPVIRLGCEGDGAAGWGEVLAVPFRPVTVRHPARAAFARRHTRTVVQVDCLGAGDHVLWADGERIGVASAAAWAAGVDVMDFGESRWGRRVARWGALSEARRALYAGTIRPAMTAAKRVAAGLAPGARAAVFADAVGGLAPALAEAARLQGEIAALAGPDGVWFEVTGR